MGQKARIDLVLDCADPAKLADFWRAALDYRDYYTDEGISVLVPKEGSASPLVLQGVPEPKSGKNRMHLDIVVDDIEPEIERLVARSKPGASSGDSQQRAPGTRDWPFLRHLDQKRLPFPRPQRAMYVHGRPATTRQASPSACRPFANHGNAQRPHARRGL